MICDYRVIQHDDNPSENYWFAIHTVFYNDSGEIISYNQDPEPCLGDRLASLRFQQEMMRNACDQDVLLKSKLDSEIGKQLRRSERRRKQAKKHISVVAMSLPGALWQK